MSKIIVRKSMSFGKRNKAAMKVQEHFNAGVRNGKAARAAKDAGDEKKSAKQMKSAKWHASRAKKNMKKLGIVKKSIVLEKAKKRKASRDYAPKPPMTHEEKIAHHQSELANLRNGDRSHHFEIPGNAHPIHRRLLQGHKDALNKLIPSKPKVSKP